MGEKIKLKYNLCQLIFKNVEDYKHILFMDSCINVKI